MKGFRFRLEPVLSVRRHREERLQRQLADSQRLLEAEKARFRSIESALKSSVVRFGSAVQPGELDVGAACLESCYLSRMEAELKAQEQRVDAQARRVIEDLNALLEASKDRKALERLKENMHLAFRRELARKEQNSAEEIATTRHLLRHIMGGDG